MSKLSKRDQEVIKDFTDKKGNIGGSYLWTDGRVLETMGMGRTLVAAWQRGKIDIADSMPQVKAHESVLRFLKKTAPKNWIKEGTEMSKLDSLLEGLRGPRVEEAREVPTTKGAEAQYSKIERMLDKLVHAAKRNGLKFRTHPKRAFAIPKQGIGSYMVDISFAKDGIADEVVDIIEPMLRGWKKTKLDRFDYHIFRKGPLAVSVNDAPLAKGVALLVSAEAPIE